MSNEKNIIPGTRPEWGYELPKGYDNSMVSKDGRAIDTGWNFDEKGIEDDPEAAEETARDKAGEKTKRRMEKAAEMAGEAE